MGVIYYKHESDYPGDKTVDRSLKCDEVDGNFYFLRGYDIEGVNYDEETNEIILTRVNGDELRLSIGQVYEGLSFDLTDEGVLIVKTPTDDFEVPGFLTKKTGAMVSTDSTLSGNGSYHNPLRVSETEKTGTFAAADEYVDFTISGGTLSGNPEGVAKGYRIVSKELVDDLGLLFDFSSTAQIQATLEENSSDWRVPSKEDWDKLLNSIEPVNDCEEDNRNHDDEKANKWLGEVAGKLLKSVDYWAPDEEAKGVDAFGLRVLPVGYLTDEDTDRGYRNITHSAAFWTTTEAKDEGDMYTKRFAYNKTTVRQDAWSDDCRLSIRLVKDFAPEVDVRDIEYVDALGINVPCVLMTGSSQVWSSVNIAPAGYGGKRLDGWDEFFSDIERKEVFIINEWDGEKWIKRQMLDGQSIVIRNFGDEHYHEYMVYSEDGIHFLLKDTVEIIEEEFQEELDEIISGQTKLREDLDAEIERATTNEDKIQANVDAEEARAISAETQLNELIVTERERAEGAEAGLTTLIEAEETRAKAIESDLTQAIANEETRATENENRIENLIETERQRAISAETDLHNEIVAAQGSVEAERDRAMAKEGELEADINDEVSRAKAKEGELEEAIDYEIVRANSAETEIRELVNELDRALGVEVVRASEAEESLSNEIAEEKVRAQGVESNLFTSISAETNYRVQADIELGNEIAGIQQELASEISRAISAETTINNHVNRIDGDEYTEGSFRKEVKDAKEELVDGASEDYNTLKKLEDTIIANKVVSGNGAIGVNESENTEISLLLNQLGNALAVTDSGLLSKLDIVYADDKIVLKANDVEISSFFATAFTQHTMIEEVQLYDVTEPGSPVPAPYIKIVWKTIEGESITRIPLSGLIDEYQAGNGLMLNSNVFSVKVASTSESFLSSESDGLKVVGVNDAITNKVNTEKAERQSEDASLSNRIDAEAVERQNTDTSLSTRIDNEATSRTSADAAIQAEIDMLNGPYNQAGSVKAMALDTAIGTIVTSISPAEAADQTLLRVIQGTGKFYASNNSGDVRYGDTSVKNALDELNENYNDIDDRVEELETNLQTASTKIAELENALSEAQSKITELEETINGMLTGGTLDTAIKQVLLNTLRGSEQQIELKKYDRQGEETTNPAELDEIKIKFASDAEFLADIPE